MKFAYVEETLFYAHAQNTHTHTRHSPFSTAEYLSTLTFMFLPTLFGCKLITASSHIRLY